jgi:NitT/TauT family transport system substrate-binding protein
MRRLRFGLWVACALSLVSLSAQAQDKIVVGYTAVPVWAAAYVGVDQGIFAKHGLNVELLFIQLNSTIPQALVSNSIQIGVPTPPVFIQANDAGLDLVALNGTTVTDGKDPDVGVLAREGSNIRNPQDFVGKKVGIPGLGASLHVLFRRWLTAKGVDYDKVHFVEIAFPQAPDVLKSGTVDAVVTGDPFMTKIVSEKIGYMVAPFVGELPAGISAGFFAATRDWVEAHAKEVAAFRAAIVEAADLANKDQEIERAAIAKFIKLPPPVIKAMRLTPLEPALDPQQIRFWFDVMKSQAMLTHDIDVDHLIWR